jgi:hypothetical protein
MSIVLLLATGLVALGSGDLAVQGASVAQAESRTIVLDPIPEGRALVYFLNASGRTLIGGAQAIKVNGRQRAKIARQEYSVVALDPGSHKLEASGRKFDLSVSAGQYCFVAYAYRPDKSWAAPFAGDSVVFTTITEQQAREWLREYRRNDDKSPRVTVPRVQQPGPRPAPNMAATDPIRTSVTTRAAMRPPIATRMAAGRREGGSREAMPYRWRRLWFGAARVSR